MHSLLVKIAIVAVMFHMTFGCSVHHGLGTNACAHQHETTYDHDHDSHGHDAEHDAHEHDDHQHPHDQLPDSEPTGDVLGSGHGSSHLGCCDDSCNATQFVQFKFESIDFSVPCLGGADLLASIESQIQASFDVDPFPDCLHSETGLRAHLLFGVQIL